MREQDRTMEKDKRKLDAAIQYLTWAIEELEERGYQGAALHARIALDELLLGVGSKSPKHDAQEVKRFMDKADEAEQLAKLAQTSSRRDALMKIAENYRRTAEQLLAIGGSSTHTKRK